MKGARSRRHRRGSVGRRAIVGILATGLCASAFGPAGSPAALAATRQAAGGPASLARVLSILRAEERSTFQADYALVGHSGAAPILYTVYHRYPDYRIVSPHTVALVLGATGYMCMTGQARPTCMKTSPIDAESTIPVPGVIPEEQVDYLTALQAGRLAGTTVSSSQRTVLGQHATCLILKQRSGAKVYDVTYCVTSKVVAYIGAATGALELTHFSGSAAPSLFALPKGAVVS